MTEGSEKHGWIALHRCIIDSKLWSFSDATFKVAIYLILEANHETKYHRGIAIERGSTVRSLTRISDDCRLSRKAVRFAIQTLIKNEFIKVDEPFGAQQGHRIFVLKYEEYQKDKGTQRAHEGSNEGSNEGNTNNNNNNDNNDNNTPPIVPPGGSLIEEIQAKRFVPPTVHEVEAYCKQRKNSVDPEMFCDFYTGKGWMIGKNKVKDWKACVRTWEKSSRSNNHKLSVNRGFAIGQIDPGTEEQRRKISDGFRSIEEDL